MMTALVYVAIKSKIEAEVSEEFPNRELVLIGLPKISSVVNEQFDHLPRFVTLCFNGKQASNKFISKSEFEVINVPNIVIHMNAGKTVFEYNKAFDSKTWSLYEQLKEGLRKELRELQKLNDIKLEDLNTEGQVDFVTLVQQASPAKMVGLMMSLSAQGVKFRRIAIPKGM